MAEIGLKKSIKSQLEYDLDRNLAQGRSNGISLLGGTPGIKKIRLSLIILSNDWAIFCIDKMTYLLEKIQRILKENTVPSF